MILIVWLHIFIRRLSCPFESLLAYLPVQGVIYDFGCGHGIMLQMLDRVLPAEVELVGWDIDNDKVNFAQTVNRSGRISYAVKDLQKDVGLRDASGIILNDVLHLLPMPDQDMLLQRCYDYLAAGGVLLVKEIDQYPSWKYTLTHCQEWLVNNVLRLTQGQGLYYRSKSAWVDVLQGTGFQVELIPAHKGYPYPHIIYRCRKRAQVV